MSVIRHPNTAGATLTQWRYTATGGETSLSGTDGFSTALSYTVGSEQVFINGVLLERGVDYVATTGTTITGLTALVVNDIATVISPSSFNVANAIPKSTVTAKGDLLVASGASTPINLAVGADGTTLVANSSSSTGVAWAGPSVAAGKNFLINGNFDIWQRATSISSTTNNGYFAADRWYNQLGTSVISQQTTGAPNGARYVLRAASTATSGYATTAQILETSTTAALWGQTVTWSFKVRRNSSMSSSMTVQIDKTSTVDGSYVGATWTNISSLVISNASLPTGTGSSNWYNAILSAAIPNDGTANTIRVTVYATAGLNNGDYYELAQAQLEVGSVATAFSRAGGTLQGELAACQRYYEKSYPLATAPGSTSSQSGLVNYIAITSSAINNRCWVPFIVSKRTSSPTITIWSYHTGASGYAYNEGTGSDYSIGIQFQAERGFNLYPTSGSFSAGQVCNFYYTADSEL